MRRVVGAIASGVLLLGAAGCTAEDLATFAAVTAQADEPGAGGTAGTPGATPSATPGATPGATPARPAGRGGTGVIVAPIRTGGDVYRHAPKWTATQFRGEPTVEQLVIRYTNEARAAEGLGPVKENVKLTVSARQHSQEMVEDGYYDHTSPTAGIARPSDRARMAGYQAGCSENIFKFHLVEDPEQLARELVDGWMKSPGHRANIVAEAAEIGVGLYRDDDTIMATQVFSKGPSVDFDAITLEDRGATYLLRLTGQASATTRFRSAWPELDDEKTGPMVDFTPGSAVTFEVAVPVGGTHVVSISQVDPADMVDGFPTKSWPMELFTLDTTRPVAEAIL